MKKYNEQKTNRQVKRVLKTAKFLRVLEWVPFITGFVVNMESNNDWIGTGALIAGVLVMILLENISFALERRVGYYRCADCGARIYPTREELDRAKRGLFGKKLICAACREKETCQTFTEKKETV